MSTLKQQDLAGVQHRSDAPASQRSLGGISCKHVDGMSTHTHICIRMSAQISIHMSTCMPIHRSKHMSMRMSVNMSKHVHTHACTNVNKHVYTHVCTAATQ